ncbi:MAG: leucyl/phenylalanyl-tRNA--protein transferase [Acidobacteriota bacterium]
MHIVYIVTVGVKNNLLEQDSPYHHLVDIVRVTRSLTALEVEAAYRVGMFPMASIEQGMVTWHKPKRRAVLPLDQFHVSRSLRHVLKQRRYEVTFDRAFSDVMHACSGESDVARDGVWISPEFKRIYGELQEQGKAHSVEIWVDGELAGGVYGVHLGGAFFAESKFHRRTNMSKVALAELVFRLRERGFELLEVQYVTEHLEQFGVIEISDRTYQSRLRAALEKRCEFV